MACPACGCKVHYQFNSDEDFAGDDERLERCAACGAVFDIEDAADDEDDAYGVTASDDARDADRYRWLREQDWNEAPLCVVANPKVAVKLGHDCPSRSRLDAAVDAARGVQPSDGSRPE